MEVDAGAKFLVDVKRFFVYVFDHWMTLVVLAVSATQTYYLVARFAPVWATWLASLGVCLMEGGFVYWRWREYEADIADGDLADKQKNKQEAIANRMVWITLLTSVFTMLAGAFMEIAESDLAGLLSDPFIANTAGLLAIVAIFLLAGLHLYHDWQYRRYDPDVVMERGWRAEQRKMDRERHKAELEGEGIVLNGRNAQLREFYGQKGQAIGRGQANDLLAQRHRQFANTAENGEHTRPTDGER